MTTETIVRKLRRLDLSKYPKEEIKYLLEQLELKLYCITYNFKLKVFLRVRRNENNSESYINVSDYSYKPFEKNTEYCRASIPNKSMFYASVVLENNFDSEVRCRLKNICAFETLPLIQDPLSIDKQKISYGLWQLNGSINLLTILDFKNYNKNPKIKEMLNHYIGESTAYNVKESEILSNFISEEFTKKCEKDYEYMISAIFSDLLCNNDSFDGILYPSVKKDYKEFNVALKPEVMGKMELLAVEENIVHIENRTQADIKSHSEGKIDKINKKITYNLL